MNELPTMLRVRGRRVVVIGGGAVALRRATSLLEAGAEVTVIAPKVDAELAKLSVTIHQRGYQHGDLRGMFLAVIATDDHRVNATVAEEAKELGVLTNRADVPELGDVIIPAHARIGPVTVAVGSGGISPRAAAVMRDQMLTELDRDWVILLETIEPVREQLQHRVRDIAQRRAAMHRLTAPDAIALLKEKGVEAMREFSRMVLEEAENGDTLITEGEEG